MVLTVLILVNVVLLDYFVYKVLKVAKNALKMNDTINAMDFEDDFWEED